MNLWLRLFRVLLKSLFLKPATEPSFNSEIHFRVWPQDCDIYLHMNNSRYQAFTDLARTYYAAELGLLSKVFGKDGISLVLQAQEFNYLRPLLPFAKFRLQSKAVWWDHRYVYFEHSFWVGADLYAWGHIRGVILKKGKRANPGEFHPILDQEPPPMPAALKNWLEMLDSKKSNPPH